MDEQLSHEFFIFLYVTTPLRGKCEVATHTPENGTWESSETLENSERDFRGQKTLHRNVLYTLKRF
jgi:hypothetical protein